MSKFAKVGYVTQQIDTLSNDIQEAIQDHITRQAVEQRFDLFEAKLKKLKRDIKNELQEFVKIEDDVKSLHSKIKQTVDSSDFETELDKIWAHFKTFNNFCQFKHLKEHMDEVKPVLEQCKHHLLSYKDDNENMKLILGRFDEILLQKASKFSVVQTEDKLKDYCLKNDFVKLQEKVSQKTNENKDQIKQVQDVGDQTLRTFYSETVDTIKGMEIELRQRIQSFLEDNTIKPDEIKNLLKAKADLVDVLNLKDDKVDK